MTEYINEAALWFGYVYMLMFLLAGVALLIALCVDCWWKSITKIGAAIDVYKAIQQYKERT